MRPTIALALIVKNEEENLPRLLKSVEGCFDEIHITDTGSTDNTVAIAQQHGAIVHHFGWVKDFAAARNASFAPVKTDYIMWMDADDVMGDRDAFIKWRDTVMNLADLWLANYWYSISTDGNPTCVFTRERVIRRDRGFEWKYFIHEGIVPLNNGIPKKHSFTGSWVVKHLRSAEDLAKDKRRNLEIFESKGLHTLDPRMKFYYGKELFENQDPVKAVHWFGEALKEQKLEFHDRILAMQFCTYAYIQTNQNQQAVQMALQGLALMPNRAEFACAIGDAFMKMNNVGSAIPFYGMAKSCMMQQQSSVQAMFSTPQLYGEYPRCQLGRIYANGQMLDKAEAELKEAVTLHGSKEARAVLDEIEKFKKTAIIDFSKATPCEDILISCPPQNAYTFDPGEASKRHMGGSETALIEMARWLHKKSGRPVKVFNMRSKVDEFEGVQYLPTQMLPDYVRAHKPWVHIAWRHNMKITDAPTFLWCHDLTTQGAENHDNYKKILCLTPFHKNYVMDMQRIPEEKIHVTRNGLISGRFSNTGSSDNPIKDEFRFVFGSSPDRGLDRCIMVLDEVRKTYPQITLHIHYGIEHLEKYGLKDLMVRLKSMIEARSWITYHGATQQEALMESYKKAAYVVQPSDWIETSCISAMEFLACGVYPIFRRVGGVADTLAQAEKAGMASLVSSDCITPEEYQRYIEETKAAIAEERYKRVKINPEELSWEHVADEWLRDLPAYF